MSKAKDLSNVPTNPTGFRNRIINGGFDVWQRGTSFSAAGFTADRWLIQTDGSGATRAISQQTFTPGNAITGHESIYHLRYNQSVAGSGATFNILDQRIEDVRTLAGQPITVSFWAKAAANTTIDSSIQQSFGSGGSSEVSGLSSGTLTVTTSWQRFTYTGTLASISGKTVGANSYAAFRINFPRNATFTVDIWGVQVERGSIATPFEQRPIGMELALCQRYFINIVEPSATTDFNIPLVRESATQGVATIFLPVTMRVRPSLVGSNIGRVVMRDTSFGTSVASVSGITVSTSGPSLSCITLIIGHGSIGGGAVFAEWDILNTTTNLSFSAEL
jgi:hypothetical protein